MDASPFLYLMYRKKIFGLIALALAACIVLPPLFVELIKKECIIIQAGGKAGIAIEPWIVKQEVWAKSETDPVLVEGGECHNLHEVRFLWWDALWYEA